MDEQARQRATELLDALFSGTLDTSTASKVREWFRTDGSVEAKYDALESVFDRTVNYDSAPGQEVWAEYAESCRKLGIPALGRPPRRRRRTLVRAAAVLIPAAVIAGIILTRGPHEEAAPHRTETVLVAADRGARESVILPDDSHVWLTPGSELEYVAGFEGGRNVTLRGKAYFEVAEEPGSPFTVTAGGMEVTVLGTQFLLTACADLPETEVVLYDGTVEVEAAGGQTLLTPGEKLTLDRATGSTRVENVELVDWRRTELSFRDETIDRIMNNIAESFGMELRMRGTAPEGHYSIGFFPDQGLDEIMATLAALTGALDYTLKDNTIEIRFN